MPGFDALNIAPVEGWVIFVIVLTSVVASTLTAAMGIGGGLLLIAVMSALVPAAAIIPVHGAIMMGSNVGRSLLLSRFASWPIVGWFLGGAALGALIGGQLIFTVPAEALRLMIAAFILYSQWGPPLRLRLHRYSFGITGTLSMILTLFVGATGPFVTTLLAQKPDLDRKGLVATAAGCLSIQHGLKVLVFGVGGFVFAPWVPLIAICIAMGFLGTLVGTKLLGRMDERSFRRWLKILLTVLAVHLIGTALWPWLSAIKIG